MDMLEQFLNFAEQSPTAFHAAANFRETLREKGFREIIEGKHDDLPESAFLFVGTIDEAVAKAKKGGNA